MAERINRYKLDRLPQGSSTGRDGVRPPVGAITDEWTTVAVTIETLVPGGGIEPPRAEARRILSPLRLPVPPSRPGVGK